MANYCQTLQLVYPLWPSTIIGFKILGFKSLIGNGNKKVWPVLGCTGNLLDFGYWLKFWLSIHEHVTSFPFTASKKQVVFSIQKNVSLKKKNTHPPLLYIRIRYAVGYCIFQMQFLLPYYPLANEVAKGYRNATLRPSFFPSFLPSFLPSFVRPSFRNFFLNTLGSTSFNGF